MYKLEISHWNTTVTIECADFTFVSDVEAAVAIAYAKHQGSMLDVPVTENLNKPVKRGRGRPAGSPNKK